MRSSLVRQLNRLLARVRRLRRRIANLDSTTVSKEGLALIQEFEGLGNYDPRTKRAYLYDDPVGYATIGFGHLVAYKSVSDLTPAERRPWARGLTISDAKTLLRNDLKDYEDGVRRLFRGVDLDADRFSALVSFAYNLGLGALSDSTLRKVVSANPTPSTNAGKKRIEDEFLRWVYGGGKVLPGLVRRRQAEADLYFGKTKERKR